MPEPDDTNLATHMSWAAAATPTMTVDDQLDLLIVDSGLPCDTFNTISRARLDGSATEIDRRIGAAIRRFGARPFSWWTSASDRPAGLRARLEAHGLEQDPEPLRVMTLDLRRLAEPHPLPGLLIERVTTPAGLAAFARINAANWSPPDPSVLEFYRLTAGAVLRPEAPLRFFLGFLGDQPVATAQLTIAGGVAGLYNVATLAEHRGRGIGTALTVAALESAAAMGHGTALLQATAGGLGIYAKLGFEPRGWCHEFKPRASP